MSIALMGYSMTYSAKQVKNVLHCRIHTFEYSSILLNKIKICRTFLKKCLHYVGYSSNIVVVRNILPKNWRKKENEMRKEMTKEVTHTTVKLAKIEMKDGNPEMVEMPDKVLIGNQDLEKAQKAINKEFGHGVTVLSIKPDTQKYVMPVEKFIELATPVKEEDTTEENAGNTPAE